METFEGACVCTRRFVLKDIHVGLLAGIRIDTQSQHGMWLLENLCRVCRSTSPQKAIRPGFKHGRGREILVGAERETGTARAGRGGGGIWFSDLAAIHGVCCSSVGEDPQMVIPFLVTCFLYG